MKVYSANDEDFNYFEISDLLNDNPELKAGDEIFVADAKMPTITQLVDYEDVFETIICRACDIGGEFGEDWSYCLNKEAGLKLEKALKRWAKKYLEPINFYSVGRSEVYVLTEKDVEN